MVFDEERKILVKTAALLQEMTTFAISNIFTCILILCQILGKHNGNDSLSSGSFIGEVFGAYTTRNSQFESNGRAIFFVPVDLSL